MKFLSPTLLLVLSSVLTVHTANATQGNPANPLPIIVQQRLNDSALTGPLVRLGTQVTQKKVNVLKAVYDFATLAGLSGGSTILKDADGGDATLPKDAYIKSVVVKGITTITSPQSNTTIQCGWDSAASNLLASTTLTNLNLGNRFTQGAIANATVSQWRRVTDGYNVAVGCKLGVSTMTAGKFVLLIEYYLGQPNE